MSRQLSGVFMSFLGINDLTWRRYRRHIYAATYQDVLDELHTAEAALVNALSLASTRQRGRPIVDADDRTALKEIIDQVRNYIDHVQEEYGDMYE